METSTFVETTKLAQLQRASVCTSMAQAVNTDLQIPVKLELVHRTLSQTDQELKDVLSKYLGNNGSTCALLMAPCTLGISYLLGMKSVKSQLTKEVEMKIAGTRHRDGSFLVQLSDATVLKFSDSPPYDFYCAVAVVQ